MVDVQRLKSEASALGRDEKRKLIRELEAQLDEPASAEPDIPGQCDGYWYLTREQIPATPPGHLPTGAVLPESRLDREAQCLDLVQLDDGWFPLSESGIYTYSHSSALHYDRECFFVPVRSSIVYRAEIAGAIPFEEVERRFGSEAAARARRDRKTIVLRLVRD